MHKLYEFKNKGLLTFGYFIIGDCAHTIISKLISGNPFFKKFYQYFIGLKA